MAKEKGRQDLLLGRRSRQHTSQQRLPSAGICATITNDSALSPHTATPATTIYSTSSTIKVHLLSWVLANAILQCCYRPIARYTGRHLSCVPARRLPQSQTYDAGLTAERKTRNRKRPPLLLQATKGPWTGSLSAMKSSAELFVLSTWWRANWGPLVDQRRACVIVLGSWVATCHRGMHQRGQACLTVEQGAREILIAH